MKTSTHRLVNAIALVAAGAVVAAPVGAAALTQKPAPYADAFQRAVNIHNAAPYPDAFERAVNVHNAASTYPDAFIRAMNIHDGPLPRPTLRVAHPGRFDWGDAGVGASGGIGLVLLLGVGGTVLLRQKHRLTSA